MSLLIISSSLSVKDLRRVLFGGSGNRIGVPPQPSGDYGMGIIEAIYLLIRVFLVSRLSLAAENLALRQPLAARGPLSQAVWSIPPTAHGTGSSCKAAVSRIRRFTWSLSANENRLFEDLQALGRHANRWASQSATSRAGPLPAGSNTQSSARWQRRSTAGKKSSMIAWGQELRVPREPGEGVHVQRVPARPPIDRMRSRESPAGGNT